MQNILVKFRASEFVLPTFFVMNERSQYRFPSDSGWVRGNSSFAPPFHPPQYQSVPSEISNFRNSVPQNQVLFPNVDHSSDSLKSQNQEPMKFNAANFPPYSNSFECVRMDNFRQQNTNSSYNHIPIFNHPLQGSNFTPSPPIVSGSANDMKICPSIPGPQGAYIQGATNSLPGEQCRSFHSQPRLKETVPLHGFHPTLASLPPQPVAPIYNVPPPPIPPAVENTSCNFQPLPPMVQNFASFQYNNIPPPPVNPQVQPLGRASEKEDLLSTFLKNMRVKDKEETKKVISVVEFRSSLKAGLLLMEALVNCKQKLSSSLHCDKDEWDAQIQCICELKKKLSSVCSVLSPDNLSVVQKRLRTIKKKRASKSRLKQEATFCRLQKSREREKIHQDIDKWLDGIKEKNLNLKREAEMKREADNILSEVRRKIHEVKRTTEKLKVFEKLRSTRQANAEQKGLYVSSEHGVRFLEQMGVLRRCLAAQLVDYEGEEHALRVMLEAEQEGQLEQEAAWRLRKTKAKQQKKQHTIIESLFGHTDEPSPTDPLFLFYQHQNAGNHSIDALVQIRHHWDVHLAENGDTIPQQWVVPFPPSSATWELSLEIT